LCQKIEMYVIHKYQDFSILKHLCFKLVHYLKIGKQSKKFKTRIKIENLNNDDEFFIYRAIYTILGYQNMTDHKIIPSF
jgi:hypothetical protein